MFVLVAYDIRTDSAEGQRRLRRIAKVCQAVGQRVQNSVFECQVDEVQCLQLVHQLRRTMHHADDNIRLYRLTALPADAILQLGKGRAIDFTEPLIL